jgi:hypothetical protein
MVCGMVGTSDGSPEELQSRSLEEVQARRCGRWLLSSGVVEDFCLSFFIILSILILPMYKENKQRRAATVANALLSITRTSIS